MIVRQYAPCSLGRSIIRLGKQGEINALRVEFDVSAWMAMYPDATVKLMHFAPDRPQDNPVIPTLGVEGTLRVWIVGEEDTAGAGNGVIELLLIDERTGSTIKSATGYTTVLRSPSAGIEAQEPEPGYVRYDVDQSALLTDTQKAFARTNIDAIKDEKDPTVPDWAKQPRKPTYTASEVGALPSSYTPPVTSVNGMTGAVALSAQDVGARPDTWTPSASEVGADAAGTASGAVAAHNVSGAAHADLRALIDGLTSRMNALADSDDTTLDQLSEIVAYIKSNKTLIDAVTTGKVSVSDIVDNLTTNASGKVLSAAQGVALKAMIDGIVIPTALPNPQPITINGQRYDGSDAVTVTTAEIDDTLTQSGKAADAKAVGDQLSALNEANDAQGELLNQLLENNVKVGEALGSLKNDLANEENRAKARENEIEALFIMPTQAAVSKWLDEHPEATTTVQDKSLTIEKMVVGTLGYVTPEMFGAIGDGVADDGQAINDCTAFAYQNKLPIMFAQKTYITHKNIDLYSNLYIYGNGAKIDLRNLEQSREHHNVWSGLSNINIQDVEFVSSNDNAKSIFALLNSSDINFTRCNFTVLQINYSTGDIRDGNSGITFDSCVFNNLGGGTVGGLWVRSESDADHNNVVFKKCVFNHKTKDECLALYGWKGTLHDCIVSECVFNYLEFDSPATYVITLGQSGHVYNIKVERCTFNINTPTPLIRQVCMSAYNIVFDRNDVYLNKPYTSATQMLIHTYNDTHKSYADVVVTNCHFSVTECAGYLAKNISKFCGNIVDGNITNMAYRVKEFCNNKITGRYINSFYEVDEFKNNIVYCTSAIGRLFSNCKQVCGNHITIESESSVNGSNLLEDTSYIVNNTISLTVPIGNIRLLNVSDAISTFYFTNNIISIDRGYYKSNNKNNAQKTIQFGNIINDVLAEI